MTASQTTINRWVPWLLAARPKTLTAAFVPILAGTLLASDIHWSLSFYAFLAAFWIQIGTNLVNDAMDFKKGADTEERLGPVRVTQKGWLTMQQVLGAGVACFALAVLCGLPLIAQGGVPFLYLLLISVVFGFLYTGGPFPLAYIGLGDLFVLIFFGWVSTTAVTYLQTLQLSTEAFLAGTQIGLLATVMIAINNFRDYEEDSKTAKRTLIVRFGTTFGRYEILTCVFLPFLLNFIWVIYGRWFAAILPWAVLPLAVQLVRSIWSTEPSKIYNRFLGQAAFLHLIFGLLLSLGFWLR